MMGNADIVLSHDFLPKVGGAHAWLYEVYRRWPDPVRLLTLAPGDAATAQAGQAFDALPHGSLSIGRVLGPMSDLDAKSPACWRAFASHVREIRRSAGAPVRLHALRAFPEGIEGLLATLLAPRTTRLITYTHGEEILIAGTSRQLQWITRRVYGQSSLVIANSDNTRRMVLEACPAARVAVIHPGVDAATFVQPQDRLVAQRQEWGCGNDTIVLATVARMEARKNQCMVIRAVGDLVAAGLDVIYVCAGDGPERSALQELATGLGLAERVRFPGSISEAAKRLVFAAADIHIMPSVQLGEMIEGFGIVFLEAAASGVPSICGRSGGQLEAVQEGRTGLSVDGRDQSAIAAAVDRLARDADLRRQMGANARVFAASLDWQLVVARTQQEIRRAEGAGVAA